MAIVIPDHANKRVEGPVNQTQIVSNPKPADRMARWYSQALPTISASTLEINSLADVEYFYKVLERDEKLPNVWRAVRNVSFPQFYWFGGIKHNRTANPYIDCIKGLPNLVELSLTFHTAGLTKAFFSERERRVMERNEEIIKSKQLKLMTLQDLVGYYKLDDVFQLRSLAVLKLNCIDSGLVRCFVEPADADPTTPVRQLGEYFKIGFRNGNGQNVEVNTTITYTSYLDGIGSGQVEEEQAVIDEDEQLNVGN